MSAIATLKARLAEVADLNAAASVLSWDQETYMPEGAARNRAHQIATLRRLSHELFVDDETVDLLDQCEREIDGEADEVDAALLRVTRRDIDRERKLPASLVSDLAESSALAQQAWKKARAADHFPTFAPHLERLLDLNRQKAEAIGFEDHLYDALLDEYEPGMATADVRRVFAELRSELVPIVHAIAERPPLDASCVHRHFDRQKQWDFGMAVLRDVGYDFEHGRQDISAHPFTTSFSLTDVRITTRVQDDFFPSAFFATLHEAGHALYEQGIDRSLDRTPLADGTSLGIHESQSRLWENMVGRSRAFWQHYYPKLQSTFPDALGGVDLDTFYRALNRVEPSLIRVEADEVTYNLHIMLRFEIELALFDGKVSVSDVPAVWNDRMEEFLGIRPPNDADGVLQDVHWSLGAFGYFPTYALGNLMSAQLFDQARREMPDLDDQIARGEFANLLAWLREKVHRHGRVRSATRILDDTTGSGLTAAPWIAYVRRKWGALVGPL
ncbi:MAG TPA: carboxypeptidase M32 [Rhodothermales bacterium]